MSEQRRERKLVTILFADLVGFTARAEEMDPEDVAALLDPYHARLKAELERRGGTVEKFIGDAVMALFGAPVTHEDDPERAVRAALAIRDAAAEEGIELRIGINTGEALVTLGARPAEGQTMATGDVVNTAARLQAAAPVGGILVGEQTHRATQNAIEYEQAEPVEAKGKARPVAVWRATAARARATVERVSGAALVGRDRELDLLGGALDRAREELSPQLVTLVGVPGIGKSRLVLELFDRIEQEEALTSWRQGRCLPYGEGITFWALGEMVKAQAGILDGDDPVEAGRKLAVAVQDPWIESHLRPLVGLAGAEGGGDRRDEAFTAWRRFFENLAAERPLVLVFEDLHWADENLLDFVDHLIDWASGVPLLVVCTARPELLSRRPGWGGGKPNALTISLSPLSDEETARLLGELLERAVLPAETQSELLARAGGNPLYAEEYARMLRERGHVEELPETVQGMIAARLDLLAPEQKSLLQDAAVVGKTFWLGALASLTGVEPRALETQLHGLERKEFVRRERASSVADDAEYAFRHLLVRDVAYGQIPRADRVEKHRLAAEWIESLGRPEDYAEMLAHHYLQALELGAAAGLETGAFSGPAQAALAVAGDRAVALNADVAAARYYKAALDLQPEDPELRARLRFRLGQAQFRLGEPSFAALEEARDEWLALGNVESAADAETNICMHFWLAGDHERATAHLERALSLLETHPPSPAKVYAVATASRLRMLASDYEAAIRLGREALAMADELGQEGQDGVRAGLLNNVGVARASIGDEEGFVDMERAIELADRSNAVWELCRAKGNLASLFWTNGRLAEGARRWKEAEGDAAQYGQLGMARWLRAINVDVHRELGSWSEALAACEAFIAEVEAGRPHYLAPDVYAVRGSIRLAKGDEAGALADAEKAVELVRPTLDPQNLYQVLADAAFVFEQLGEGVRAGNLVDEIVVALEEGTQLGASMSKIHVFAWVAAALGRGSALAAALARFADNPWASAAIALSEGDAAHAAAICAEMGALPNEAFARLAAAKRLAEEGRRAEADEQLRRALAFFRSVGATRYVREGEALLAASA